jgi:hypothetical protein
MSASLHEIAARNNAAWCDAVCRTHTGPGMFTRDLWHTPHGAPRLYPDAITLAPTITADDIAALSPPPEAVKDSYATLDLAPLGYRMLFAATWIAHAPWRPSTAAPRVASADALAAWEVAWGGPSGTFRPALLARRDIAFLRFAEGGAVLNAAEGAVGVSNLFGPVWAEVIAAAAGLYPGLPLVGYESGDDLAAAERAGFAPVGPLRVWVRA